MKTRTPYRHADKALIVLFAMMNREFQNLGTILRSDMSLEEVRARVEAVYSRMDKEIKRKYRTVAEEVRHDTEEEIKFQQKKRWAATAFVLALLRGYDPVTKYVYTAEWTRKRDRLVESIMASEGHQQIRVELKRAMDVLSLQIRQYADNITDAARMEVFLGAGITDVLWNTQHDEKVCATCASRDMEIYPIDEVPEKHYRCRCYLTAISNKEEI